MSDQKDEIRPRIPDVIFPFIGLVGILIFPIGRTTLKVVLASGSLVLAVALLAVSNLERKGELGRFATRSLALVGLVLMTLGAMALAVAGLDKGDTYSGVLGLGLASAGLVACVKGSQTLKQDKLRAQEAEAAELEQGEQNRLKGADELRAKMAELQAKRSQALAKRVELAAEQGAEEEADEENASQGETP